MKNSIYRKVFLLILLTVLLLFGVQGIGFSQLPISPDKIKDSSTRYVVWIVHEKGSGSGVLISKDYRLVVTNAHVTGDYKEVEVFFGVRDSSGNIVRAQPFYRNQDHQNTLQRLGYVTRGRVIAKYQYPENEPDLAMIELDGLPETVSPLKLLTSIDYSKMQDEPVHILGHPAERDLWHWKAGFFKEKKDSDLHIFADAYYGNSGGPVLNKDGNLIGITRAINADKGITFAVPTSAIIDLYKTLEPVEIFSIYNNTELAIKYKIQWNEDENWKEEELVEPKKERLHPLLSKDITTGYPKIGYENSQNGKESPGNVQELETKSRFFGVGTKDAENFDSHIESNDALRYQFMSDPETKKISLVKLKRIQTVMIHNNTQAPLFFQHRWHEDEKWKEVYLKSSEAWKSGELSERVSLGYPKIRFNEISGDRNDLEKSSSLLTETGYFDKTTEIKEDIKQTGWNPPLYYQFKNNVGTNGISLEELKRTQRFKIQNSTDVSILFKYKWHENDIWEFDYIRPNDLKVYDKQHEIDPSDSPEISYSENVNVIGAEDSREIRTNVFVSEDNKSAENIQKIEAQIGYSNKNSEFIPDQYQFRPFEYRFKYNSKTKQLSLDEGLLTITNKSTGRSFPFFPVVLIAALIIEVVVIIGFVVFPKRHIFSLQNNTGTTVNYQTKWTEKRDWKPNSLEPGKSRNHWWTGSLKKVPQDYPKAQFETTVGDKKETKEYTLETYSWRLGPRGIKKISREEHAREYHFELDSETKALNLVDSENNEE
ncbi:MAG: serine protease [Candidatus Poribacteria bacterium]|nr:serine protease [Candidatus Poribacteria bacterium]